MNYTRRIYDSILAEHLSAHRQMAFLSGPRQVGKTATARRVGAFYLDWDNRNHQDLILQGPEAVARHCGLQIAAREPVVIVFDELHKFSRWKNFLKGLFDTYEARCRIVVTGSARLDVYRRGGDSLMGRYFPYRLHPFTTAELARSTSGPEPISPPQPISNDAWDALWRHGGFPEPFLKRSPRFSHRWRTLRDERLFKEELRDLTRVHEFGLLQTLARLLATRSGGQLIYANLAGEIQVSPHTAQAWVGVLASTYYGFLVRPWFRNVSRALRKEPKWYVRDWSGVGDPGAKAETFAAGHLLKAVEYWTDAGWGDFELYYLRDKQKREVDFLVTKNDRPWFLVEIKQRETSLSPALAHFQQQTGAAHAFQAVLELPYAEVDCYAETVPVVVPARTLFSQWV